MTVFIEYAMLLEQISFRGTNIVKNISPQFFI